MQTLKTTRRTFLAAVPMVSAAKALLDGSAASATPAAGPSPVDVFEQVWQTVNRRFFDPDFNGVDWQAVRETYRPQAAEARSQAELASVVNEMLGLLRTSHTRLFTPDEPAYYQLLGVFLPVNDDLRRALQRAGTDDRPEYTGIGIFTQEIDGRTFVSAVLDGGPAARAGLLVGDALLAADGQPFHPMRSFADRATEPVALLIQRTPNLDSRQEVTVVPAMLDGTTMFLDAMRASIDLVERGGRQIGYVHVWSYAGTQYQEELEQTLLFGRLREADALVLDLRDGWGGASPSYLNLFTPRTIDVTSIARGRGRRTFSSGWSKPVVMLVNGNTRSGKELLAYGFRRHGIGPVVGSRTAGAVVQGYLSAMDDGSLLYLAVGDALVDGDQRLEGVGVTPDIEVPFSLAYAEGADPQKEQAIEVARAQVAPG